MTHNELWTNSESYFQTLVMMILHVADVRVEPEVANHLGYADLVAWIGGAIYVIELKLDRPTCVAMKQIKERKYYQGLFAEQKPIFLVGMSCSSKERAVMAMSVESLQLKF